ncbi:hypothetical protein C8J57DRAFT_1012304, partial [Mycena rebaudengoi]
YHGDLPSWSSTIQLLTDLKLIPFQSGLTAMQLVNTLMFSKVVQMLTIMEMGTWIAANNTLGAATGLKKLGFWTDTCNETISSYVCFHNYLATYLVCDDQEKLGFHPPFSEHLLCKVPRWEDYLEKDKCINLTMRAEWLGVIEWVAGANGIDHKAMPFPLVPTRETLEMALKNI